ncbi:hypothetical protein JXL19_07580 [bacterium]|nr:hypothetical protein [bacterium]
MVKNPDLLKKIEYSFIEKRGKLSFEHALRIFTSMWNEGVHLGVLPPRDPLEGISVDIKIAKALNSCSKKSFPG